MGFDLGNILGTGEYQATEYNVDQNAFNNPNYQAGAYGNAQAGYLGDTTKPVVAQQAAAGDYGNYNQGTAGQLGMANQYQQMAQGNGPSMANVQAQQQGAANLAATESMLGSARGAGSPAAAQMAARNAATSGQQQVAQNAVMGRTSEEMGAMSGAAGLYGNVAGQGLQQVGLQQANNQFNAGQGNQVGMANQANNLAAYTNNLNSLSTQGLAQQQGTMAGQQLGSQNQLGYDKIQSDAFSNSQNNRMALFGGVLNGLGAAGKIAAA
jgi:hypothetical protein